MSKKLKKSTSLMDCVNIYAFFKVLYSKTIIEGLSN